MTRPQLALLIAVAFTVGAFVVAAIAGRCAALARRSSTSA
jgi:hypothetical protein